MPGKRTPLIGELLGGVSLVALAGLAVTWGGLLRSVDDHIDPQKHQGIVLAGNIDTERKITAIETNVANIQQAVQENKETAGEIKEDVTEVKMDVRVLLEMQRQLLDIERAREARRAASAGTP